MWNTIQKEKNGVLDSPFPLSLVTKFFLGTISAPIFPLEAEVQKQTQLLTGI